MIFVQLLINGIIAGSIYALVASGFSVIYSTNRFAHFAHGAVIAVGAYILYSLFTLGGLNFYVAAVLTVLASGVLGGIIYWVLYRPLKRRNASAAILLIASLGLLILLENTMQIIFGADVKTLGFLKIAKGMEIFGAIITPLQVVIVAVALILLVSLWIFVHYSQLGKKMLAVADNPDLADVSGINPDRIQLAAFVVGSGLAGVASVLIALEQNIEPTMGMSLIVSGFTGAIIGGVTSLPGAVLGSYILGLVENFGIWYLPSGYKGAIAFGLLFIFLIFRPTGILGINKGARE